MSPSPDSGAVTAVPIFAFTALRISVSALVRSVISESMRAPSAVSACSRASVSVSIFAFNASMSALTVLDTVTTVLSPFAVSSVVSTRMPSPALMLVARGRMLTCVVNASMRLPNAVSASVRAVASLSMRSPSMASPLARAVASLSMRSPSALSAFLRFAISVSMES